MTNSFTNTDITKIKEALEDYYNSLIIDEDKTDRSNNKTPYFFNNMKNISTIRSDDFDFNQFIHQCINYKIGKKNNNNIMLEILEQNNTANNVKINNIQKYINTISVIIDILEAYKNYIDINENYISIIPDIKTIKLQSSTTTTNNGTYGNNILILNIKSFSTNINNIFTLLEGETLFQTFNKFTPADSTTLNPYISPLNTKEKLQQSKDIINNLLYFLINITGNNAKIEIYALYNYYNLVKCYMLLTCSSTNIAINDITTVTSSIHNIRLTTNNSIYTSSETLLLDYTDISKRDVSVIKNEYNIVSNYVFNELNILQQNFYANSILSTLESENFNFTINSNNNKTPNSTEIKVSYTSDTSDNINTIINTSEKINLLKKNYYIKYNNKYYKFLDINKIDKIITIEAKLYSNVSNDISNIQRLPDYNSGIISMPNCRFVKSNFITLKKDYYNNKDILSNINDNIKTNSIKLNDVKKDYENNKLIDDTLNIQITAIHFILLVIILIFIGILTVDINEGIKKLVALTIAGIILLMIIIIYIMNTKNNNIENFTTVTAINDTTKIDFLEKKYSSFNAQAKIYIDSIKQFIKNTDSKDLYDDLLHIMDIEKYDKNHISNILDHKKILGENNIDVYKYDYYNKQIYINTILISALFVVILYLIYNMNPKIEKNLLLFIGFILFIIISTYYIINTNNLVHSKSSHYYWKPMDLSRA